MGNPDRAESRSVQIKPSHVCLKMLGRNKAWISHLLEASWPPRGCASGWRGGGRTGCRAVTDVANARGSEGAGPCLPVASGPGVLLWGRRRGPGWGRQKARPLLCVPGSPGSQREARGPRARAAGWPTAVCTSKLTWKSVLPGGAWSLALRPSKPRLGAVWDDLSLALSQMANMAPATPRTPLSAAPGQTSGREPRTLAELREPGRCTPLTPVCACSGVTVGLPRCPQALP